MSTNSENPKLDPVDPEGAVLSNREKDPDDWVTGDERMTGAQASYLKTLCEEAREEFDPSLTKAEASKRIDALQQVTGRGRSEGHDGVQESERGPRRPGDGPAEARGRG